MHHANPQKTEYVHKEEALSTVPAVVMRMEDLQLLDLSMNKIKVLPKHVVSSIPHLKHLNLSHNSLNALPANLDDLKELEVLRLDHNAIISLPESLCLLPHLRELHVAHNQISELAGPWHLLTTLQVLNAAYNQLRVIPPELGWLPLKQLNISNNPDPVPPHVLQRSFRAVLSYLQMVGEQHHTVDAHMADFVNVMTHAQQAQLSAMDKDATAEGLAVRLRLAERCGVLAADHLQLELLPPEVSALTNLQVADLRWNWLTAVPPELLHMRKLTALNLAYNQLATFPTGISLPHLCVLNLSFNKLELLPDDMGTAMPALSQLYAANNRLTALPSSLALAPLADVFVSENMFRDMPPVLCLLEGLAQLSLAACLLECLPGEIGNLSNLRFLDASFNRIAGVPTTLAKLCMLSALNLGHNPLGEFPPVLGALGALHELNLDSTGVAVLPPEVGALRTLEELQLEGCPLLAPYDCIYRKDPRLLVALHNPHQAALDLSGCGLAQLPEAVVLKTALTDLDLSDNALADLPPELGRLTALSALCLARNPLRGQLARVAAARGDLAVVRFLDEGANALDLGSCGLDALPEELLLAGRRGALRHLKLPDNRLADLPQDLTRLSSLTMLTLDSNLFCQLPACALQLPRLEVLMASNNQLSILPDHLGSCTQLQALMLHCNTLADLPDALTRLTGLRALGVSSNRLTSLPEGLGAMGGLRLLDVSYNALQQLPVGIGGCSQLRSVKAAYNQLRALPEALTALSALRELQLAHNPHLQEAQQGTTDLNAASAPAVKRLLRSIPLLRLAGDDRPRAGERDQAPGPAMAAAWVADDSGAKPPPLPGNTPAEGQDPATARTLHSASSSTTDVCARVATRAHATEPRNSAAGRTHGTAMAPHEQGSAISSLPVAPANVDSAYASLTEREGIVLEPLVGCATPLMQAPTAPGVVMSEGSTAAVVSNATLLRGTEHDSVGRVAAAPAPADWSARERLKHLQHRSVCSHPPVMNQPTTTTHAAATLLAPQRSQLTSPMPPPDSLRRRALQGTAAAAAVPSQSTPAGTAQGAALERLSTHAAVLAHDPHSMSTVGRAPLTAAGPAGQEAKAVPMRAISDIVQAIMDAQLARGPLSLGSSLSPSRRAPARPAGASASLSAVAQTPGAAMAAAPPVFVRSHPVLGRPGQSSARKGRT